MIKKGIIHCVESVDHRIMGNLHMVNPFIHKVTKFVAKLLNKNGKIKLVYGNFTFCIIVSSKPFPTFSDIYLSVFFFKHCFPLFFPLLPFYPFSHLTCLLTASVTVSFPLKSRHSPSNRKAARLSITPRLLHQITPLQTQHIFPP